MSRFDTYHIRPGDNTPGAQVRVRISKGDEEVNTLAGVTRATKGAAIVERPDMAGVFDVIPAESFPGDVFHRGPLRDSEPDPEPADTTRVVRPPATNPGPPAKRGND
jgi:hypothetical protein